MFKRFNWRIFFELLGITFVAVVLISGVRFFVAQPFVVTGDSMVPTFQANEYLVIDELNYYLHKPQRGDVVIFRYPLDPSIFFIKRLIGVPGDTVQIANGAVLVRPRGAGTAVVLDEPYIKPESQKDTASTSTITLDDDEYFMLGDNRNESFDSRAWGPVPGRYLVGRAFARLYPFNRASVLPGEYHSLLSTPNAQ